MFARAARFVSVSAVLPAFLWFTPAHVQAARPTPAQALQLTPIQANVDYDTPTAEETDKCTVEPVKEGDVVGWALLDPTGRPLRRFLDTNGDNKVDLWCYYQEGVEVYRDVDGNFNGKADQYRWLGLGGTRWGVDRDENGTVDEWRMISAEEVTAEITAALRERDAARFQRILLTDTELKSLGLGEARTKEIAERITKATAGFADLAKTQEIVTAKTEWTHFGASRPGIVPAGTAGSTKDIVVYDNVMAVIQTDDKMSQIAVGTLIRVGDNWRAIELPQNLLDDQTAAASTGFFHTASMTRRPDIPGPTGQELSEAAQRVFTQLEQVEKDLAKATTAADQSRLNARRADLLEQLIGMASSATERENWVRQYADTISAAAQSGSYPDGVKRLETYFTKLTANRETADIAAYVKLRALSAAYSLAVQNPKADYAKIQTAWLSDLEEFIRQFGNSPGAAEAMLQLAVAKEFSGEEDEALRWYARIVADHSTSPMADKAAGAKRRLESVGQKIELKGTSIDDRPVDLADLEGKVVLIHYWATWCEPCKQDLEVLKNMHAKYGSGGFTLIGISLDSDRQTLTDYLQANRLPWPQLYEDGGLDNRFADELGILTLPVMILIDKDGKVLHRNIQAAELDAELGKLLR